MICYRDMTFCSNGDKCDMASKCRRDMTPQDRARAESMGIPVSVAAFYKEGKECSMFWARPISYVEETKYAPKNAR